MPISDILKEKGINHSQFRIEVLDVLKSSKKPLSQKEIEKKVCKPHDRVTLYRTLKLFVEKNLIHRIPVGDNIVAFRFMESGKTFNQDHLHFFCTSCNKVFCMPQVQLQQYELPKGFKADTANLVVNGLCNICNETKK